EECRVARERAAQVRWNQARLPVVAMEDLSWKEVSRNREGSLSEDGVTNVIVGIIGAGFSVESFAAVEQRAIHEIERKFRVRGIDRRIVSRRAEVNRQVVIDPA